MASTFLGALGSNRLHLPEKIACSVALEYQGRYPCIYGNELLIAWVLGVHFHVIILFDIQHCFLDASLDRPYWLYILQPSIGSLFATQLSQA